MAEGGFDPCECICSHEHAMRRLLNLVRQVGTRPNIGSCTSPSPLSLSGCGHEYNLLVVAWIL
uniref:Small integral membrane protein 14 n=1 Tax=Eptatretus burgeri TaxID=7764 RepID=A0A8C4QH85_EPTBU